MYVFIDEAGDVGFKFKKGASDYFVIALIIFDSIEEMDRADNKIQLQRIKDKLKVEYKSFSTKKNFKSNFFDAIRDINFKISYIVVNKNNIYDAQLRCNPKMFYDFFLKKIIDATSLNNANVKIDETSSVEIHLKQYLNRENIDKIKKMKFENSKSNNLIQLADMIAGALFGYYKKRNKNNEKYRETFKSKIIKDIIIE
jgi:hypothetical protein